MIMSDINMSVFNLKHTNNVQISLEIGKNIYLDLIMRL